MPEQESIGSTTDKPKTDTSVQVPLDQLGNQNPPIQPSDNNASDNRATVVKLEKDIKSGEGWLIGIGIVTILVNIGIGLVYLGQLSQMRKATNAAALGAYIACENAQIARSTLLELQAGGIDTHGFAVASTYEAMAATQAESATITVTLRPEPIQVNKTIDFSFQFQNTGKTTAKNVTVKAITVFLPRNQDPDFSYPHLRIGRLSIGSLYPREGSHPGIYISAKNEDASLKIATDADSIDYQKGRKDAMVYGIVSYTDIFGVNHWSRFCGVNQHLEEGLMKDTGHTKCAAYNKDDTNHPVYNANPNTPQPVVIPEIECVKPKEN